MKRAARARIGARVVGIALLISAFAMASKAAVLADADAAITISGRVEHPQGLTFQDLQKLPPVHVQISFLTVHGTETGDFTGALLWAVLDNAVPIDDPGRNARLRHVVLVTGRDGYVVALSEAELDPDFEGKQVIFAYAKDGRSLDTWGVRLIVPGDKHGGRAIRDIEDVNVR